MIENWIRNIRLKCWKTDEDFRTTPENVYTVDDRPTATDRRHDVITREYTIRERIHSHSGRLIIDREETGRRRSYGPTELHGRLNSRVDTRSRLNLSSHFLSITRTRRPTSIAVSLRALVIFVIWKTNTDKKYIVRKAFDSSVIVKKKPRTDTSRTTFAIDILQPSSIITVKSRWSGRNIGPEDCRINENTPD